MMNTDAPTKVLNLAAPSRVGGPLDSIGFHCALGYVFLRFSDLHEMVASATHLDNYVLYVFAPIAILAAMLSGRLAFVLRQSTAKFWLGFAIWMVLAVPFSTWKGGSIAAVSGYYKVNFIMLLIIAPLSKTWVECRRVIYTIAAAASVDVVVASVFARSVSGRLQLEWSGTIGNSNDLAAHLLLVLPFLLFIGLKPYTPISLRVASFSVVALGAFQILRTASRGALIALLFCILLIFIRGSARQRLTVIAVAIVTIVFIGMLPSITLTRLTSFSHTDSANQEALESSDIRQYELKRSVIDSLTHPLFGLGPGQFPSFEGMRVKRGGPGWLETHNSYTQISSECGLPALGFYIAALVSTLALLGRIREKAEGPYAREIKTASYCMNLGVVGYAVATLFVNFGYTFHLLSVSGLAIAMWSAVVRQRRQLRLKLTRQLQLTNLTESPSILDHPPIAAWESE